MQRLRPSRRGHLYFELVEKGEGDRIVGKLDGVIWKSDFQRVRRELGATGQELADGVQIRCRGKLDFWGPAGRLQLVVREVDPVFTLGLLAQRRNETLTALVAGGLMDLNKGLALSPVPLRVALITSEGSAAYHDFLSSLRGSGYGFRVLFVHSSVQGAAAEGEVVSALSSIPAEAVDCAVLIRGGGSRTDLAVFDSRPVAETVARCPVPVITGLGHEIDESIADLVAHSRLTTPTKAAEFLIERTAGSEATLRELAQRLGRASLATVHQGREALGRAYRGAALARLRLTAGAGKVDDLARTLAVVSRSRLRETRRRPEEAAGRLAAAAPKGLARARETRRRLGRRLSLAGRVRLRETVSRVEALARLSRELGPERTLARGYSITVNDKGNAIRRPEQVALGERIITRLAGGRLVSRVEER